MTAALVLAALLLGAAIAFLLKARTERNRREAAEQHARRLELLVASHGDGHREWLAVLGHELRSPVAAILGYGELLADGTFGPLDERAADAVQRLRSAADQLIGLIDGIDTRGGPREGPPDDVPASIILNNAAAALRHEAEARQVELDVDDAGTRFTTRPHAAERSLVLALGAAIKVSSGGSIRIHAEPAPEARIVITGTRLDPARDDPDRAGTAHGSGVALTGAGLRIALAREAARAHGGTVTLHASPDGTRVHITVPPDPIDSAEDTP